MLKESLRHSWDGKGNECIMSKKYYVVIDGQRF